MYLGVTPSSSTYTGGVATNIYLGYGPQKANLSVNASGGSGFTYSWSPTSKLSCATCANPQFAPTSAGNYTYTVTVKNSYGCTSTCSVTFCVKDIRERDNDDDHCDDDDDYTGKVWICHKSGSSYNSISISTSAVPSHLSNHSGDRLGKCSQQCGTTARMAYQPDNILSDVVKVYPNPNNGSFTIDIPFFEDQAAITVTDVAGKIIQQKVIREDDGNTVKINLGDAARGIYFVDVNYDGQIHKTKVLIQ